jgi:amidohydrolase
MKSLSERLSQAADSVLPEVIRIRRQLHQHPELSGNEGETSRFIAAQCRNLGFEVQEGIGGHGLLATLEHNKGSGWIGLRADMDALPIHDQKDQPYSSCHAGISHACGHDAHSAMLLGAMMLLKQSGMTLTRNLACIFQPAEETCEGAAAMLRTKQLQEIPLERIYALHVFPYLPAGSLGLREGPMCAAADMFEVEISGHGGHAARPHETTDVVFVASHVIQALHHIVSRRINPLHPAVLSIGHIEGGHAANVIPERVRFSGTFRSLHPEAHEEIRARMDHIIRHTAETWGATARFTLNQATPLLHNDEAAMLQARNTFSRLIPDIPLLELSEPSMGGEDFAAFMQQVSGCLFRLGTGAGPATRYPLHHPCFDIEESAMRSGMLALAALAIDS